MQRRCVFTLTVLAVFAWVGGASAQNPFFDSPEEYWGSYDYQEQQERTQGYYDRQDEALQDALDRWGKVEDSPEYRSWERQRGLDACLGITNNPALQSRCLQGLQ